MTVLSGLLSGQSKQAMLVQGVNFLMPKKTDPGKTAEKPNSKEERAERLAAQLRANLKKRKAQSRDRAGKEASVSQDDGESGQS